MKAVLQDRGHRGEPAVRTQERWATREGRRGEGGGEGKGTGGCQEERGGGGGGRGRGREGKGKGLNGAWCSGAEGRGLESP